MSDEKFQDAEYLKAWLIKKGVDPEKAGAVFQRLFTEGYDLPSTLIGITYEDLEGYGIKKPVARHISNLLVKEQKQDGKLRCCSRILVFECCFEYGNVPAGGPAKIMLMLCVVMMVLEELIACSTLLTFSLCVGYFCYSFDLLFN
jgi:hypothetical protein